MNVKAVDLLRVEVGFERRGAWLLFVIEVDEGLGIWVGSIGGGFVGGEGSGCGE